MSRTTALETAQLLDTQDRGDSSLSFTSGARPESSREALLTQLKLALEHYQPGQRALTSPGQNSELPVSEAQLLKRSASYARSALVQANRDGLIHSSDIAQNRPSDLASIDIEHFVIQAFDKSSNRSFRPESERGAKDVTFVQRNEDSIIAVLSDGVSAAPLSRYGAAIIGESVCSIISRHLKDLPGSLLDANFLASVYTDLYKEIHHLAAEIGLHPIDACEYCFAATFHITVITPEETIVFGLGDGHLKAGTDWEDLIGRTDKGGELSRYNIPPLLSAAIIGDYGLSVQRSEMHKQATRFEREGQYAVADVLRQNADMVKGYHEEAFAFRIYRYQSTAETLDNGLTLTSDGLRYTSLSQSENQRELAFPHLALINPPRAGQLAELMNLWNIATEDSALSEEKNIRLRLQHLNDLYRQHAVIENDLVSSVIERAIENSASSYTRALGSLSAAEIVEYCALEVSQSVKLENDLLLLGRSLKHQAIEALRACLPDSGVSEDARLIPLRDDFSQITVKRGRSAI